MFKRLCWWAMPATRRDTQKCLRSIYMNVLVMGSVSKKTGLCSHVLEILLLRIAEPGGTQSCQRVDGICSGHGFCTLHGFCTADRMHYRKLLVAIEVIVVRTVQFQLQIMDVGGEKHPCSGHGEYGPDGVLLRRLFSGKVGCDIGWSGADLRAAVKKLVNSDCPSKTYRMLWPWSVPTLVRCSCNFGWETPDCHVPSSSPKYPKIQEYKTCGGHGVCLENSKCGCECGFSGQSCSIGLATVCLVKWCG